jgi:hypothetical protein
MSLKITNKATPKQLELLKKLEYIGRGKYAPENLTGQEAGKLIDELFVHHKYTYGDIKNTAGDYYDFPPHIADEHEPDRFNNDIES